MTGLVSQHTRRTSVGQGALSRGDVSRNARRAALRAVLPRDHAILGIDLAQSRQAAVLASHDSRVLAPGGPRGSPWELGDRLGRGARYARSEGVAGVHVAVHDGRDRVDGN